MMALNQAYLAALAGATYVSIFSGRVRDMGYDVKPIVRSMREIFDREGLASKIIVGSMRHMMDVNEALDAGAHIPTITPPILRKMVWNPRTIETIQEFNSAWRSRPKKK
jgi:transaldolase